jgi:hypothetical protein
MVPMHLGLKNGPFVPLNLIRVHGSPVPSLKFQMAPRLKLLMSSGSKRKEPRYTCLSEAKVSHARTRSLSFSLSGSELYIIFQYAVAQHIGIFCIIHF